MIYDNYLDIGNLIFNELIGDVWLAVFTGLVIIFIVIAMKKLDIHLMILAGCLWLIMVFARYQNLEILWILVLLVMGFMFYYELNKVVNQ